MYDNDELTLEVLEEYADLVYDGTQPEEIKESE
jgi:hypothetical protein